MERSGSDQEERSSLMGMHDFANFAAPAPHPGEHLREDYLPAYNLSAGALAKAMGLKDRARIERLVREKQSVTADTALRLGLFFGMEPRFWMNLQTEHDMRIAARTLHDKIAPRIRVFQPDTA